MFGRGNPAPRRRAMRRRNRRNFLLKAAGAVFLAALAGYLVWEFRAYLQESPDYLVRYVDVEGAHVLREEAIIAASGITQADSLIELDIDAVAARVTDMAYIQSAVARRAFPDRVILHVVERTPVATLLIRGQPFELDEDGVVLRALDPLDPHVGPIITPPAEVGVITPGDPEPVPGVLNALAVWRVFEEEGFDEWLTVSELAIQGESTVLMYCDEVDFEIRWGRTDYAVQARNLRFLWEAEEGDLPCEHYLDLRFDADIVCR